MPGCDGRSGDLRAVLARASLTSLEGLGSRGADAERMPAVEGHDGAAHREEHDGTDDEGSGGPQTRQVCAANSHLLVIGGAAKPLSVLPKKVLPPLVESMRC
jgi:hypothetical protein